jgi:hypothetical protein
LADPRNRDRVFEWLASKLREKKTTDASAEDLIARGRDLLKLFPNLEQVIDHGDFRTFLLRYYSPPPPPEPEKVTTWSARALKILGKMIDDLPHPQTKGARAHLANGFQFGGILLADLLRFATPDSLGKKLLDYWLALVALAGLLLILVGTFSGSPGIALIGYGVELGCLAVWALARSFSNWLRGRSPLRQPAIMLIVLIVVVLAGLGLVKVWEIYNEVHQHRSSEVIPDEPYPAVRRAILAQNSRMLCPIPDAPPAFCFGITLRHFWLPHRMPSTQPVTLSLSSLVRLMLPA